MAHTQQTDQELIRAYRAGELTALDLLIGRHLTSVYNFIYRLTNGDLETDDIVQQTFLKVWRYQKQYKLSQNFKTWLFTIAHNAAIDWLRKKKPVPLSTFDQPDGTNVLAESLVSLDPLPDALVAKIEQRQLLDQVLPKLELLYREVVLLRYVEQLTFEEISHILKRPLKTVQSQHRRALLQLRTLLDASNTDPRSYI